MNTKRFYAVLLLFFSLFAVFGILINTANAGAGSISEFRVDSEMNVHVRVTCPGSGGFNWRVSIDSLDGTVLQEQTTDSFVFTLRQYSISNGRHDLWLRHRCLNNGESWEQGTTGKTTFDWNGGNPPPVNPPPAGSGCNISLNPGNSSVPPNTSLNFTANANCADRPDNTGITIRFFVNGVYAGELGSPTMHYTWPGAANGNHQVCAEGRSDSDPNWQRSARQCASVSVSGNITVPQPGNPVTNVDPPQNNNNSGGSSLPRYAEARQGGVNGGVEVIVYCYAAGYTGAVNTNERHDGWHCTFNNGASLIPINWSDLCHDVWGSNYSYDIGSGGRNDIRCVMGQGNQSLPQNQSNGSGSGNNVRPQPTARSNSSTTYVQPNRGTGNACSQPRPVEVGDSARVTPGAPNNMRAAPSLGSDRTGSIPGGAQITIVGGPECNDGYRWWQVNYNGLVGWTADGDNGEYWIEAVRQQAQPTPVPSQPRQPTPVPAMPVSNEWTTYRRCQVDIRWYVWDQEARDIRNYLLIGVADEALDVMLNFLDLAQVAISVAGNPDSGIYLFQERQQTGERRIVLRLFRNGRMIEEGVVSDVNSVISNDPSCNWIIAEHNNLNQHFSS